MAEESIIKEFLKEFKISLINAGVYFKEHPVFVRSIKRAEHILNDILSADNALFIGVAPDAILVKGEYLKDNEIYASLSRHLHYRKIKSVTFSKGVTTEELSSFFLITASSFKDIAKSGGVKRQLSKEHITHISVQELDYRELLENVGGNEDKDIWKFLIEESYYGKVASSALEKLSDSFENVLYKFSSDDLRNDASFISKLIKALYHIKKYNPQKFKDNSKVMVKFILDRNKDFSNEEVSEDIGSLLKDLDSIDLTDIIWERSFESDKFDPFALKLFSRFISDDMQKAIASSIENKYLANKMKLDNNQVKERLKELVSYYENKSVSRVYRDTLNKLLEHIELNGTFSLDYNRAYRNYAYSLLNMFCLEDRELRLEIIASSIIKEWPKIAEMKDIRIIRYFLESIDKKAKDADNRNVQGIYSNISKCIAPSLESIIFNNIDILEEKDALFFSNFIPSVRLGAQAWIAKIIENEPSRDKLIKLFFKFFPDDINLLSVALRSATSRFKTANNIINILSRINTIESLKVLEGIFSAANLMLKIDILKIMQSMSVVDEKFILKLLKSSVVPLRKEALKVITGRSKILNLAAVNNLLNIFNPFGIRNNVLIDNIRIIAGENIKEAKYILEIISKKHYFWKEKALKKAIKESLTRIEDNE